MSSYRSYVPWNKSGLSSSYSAGSKSTDSPSTSSSQYDGGGRRYSSGGGTSSSYLGSSYRSTPSSYLGSSYSSGSSYLKDKDSGGGSSYLSSSIKEKDTAGRVPKEAGSSYLSSSVKDKTSLNKENRDTSTDRLAQLRDKYQKKDTSPEPPADRYGSNSLSPYCRLYGRSSSYTRSSSRTDSEPSASTPSSPSHAPTSLRFGTASRYGSSMIRSPVSEKPPPVFGLSGLGYSRSLSRSSSTQQDTDKSPTSAPESPLTPSPDKTETAPTEADQKKEAAKVDDTSEEPPRQTTFITVVTRGTSPTPPSSSPYLRSRRTELARVLEKTIAKPATRPETCDKEIQSDRGDDTARLSRYGRWSAASTSSYLDRYPAASRYSRYGSTYSSRLSEDNERKSDTSKSSYSPTSSASVLSVDKSTSSSSVDKNKTESVRDKTQNITSVKSSESKEVVASADKKVDSKNIVTAARDSVENKVTGVNNVNSKFNTASSAASTNSAKNVDSQVKTVPTDSVNKASSGDGKNVLITRSPSSAKVEETQKTPAFQKSSATKEPQLVGNKDGAAAKTEVEAAKALGTKSAKVGETKSSGSETKVTSNLPPKSTNTSASSSDIASKTVAKKGDNKEDISSGETKTATGLTRAKSVKNLVSKPNLSLDTSAKKSTSSEDESSSPSSTSKSPCDKPAQKITSISTSVDNKKDSTTNTDVVKKVGLSRASSMKNLSLKPPLQPDVSKQKASSSGDESASPKHNNSKPAAISKTDEASRKTGDLSKDKEASATTKSNEEINLKPNSKLPPPVPKSDLRPSASAHSLGSKMTSKEFRKSALNMEISNSLQAEALKKQRSLTSRSASSASSGGESDTALHPSKSNSRLPSPSAQLDAITAELKNRSRRASSSSSSSSSTSSSSCTSSSSSESESSDEEDDPNVSVPAVRRRRRGSPTMQTSADESSLKPPLPPKSPEQPRSLLVRAVTSLFRFGRSDTTGSSENLSQPLEQPTEDGSTKSASEQRKDTACNGEIKGEKKLTENDGKPPLGIQKDKSTSSIKNAAASEKNKKKVYKIRHHESGELPWWQVDSANVPEGVQRVSSNSSINNTQDSDKLLRVPSNSTINKLQDKSQLKTNEEKGDRIKKKLHKIRHQPSGELPWWLDSNKPIPEGIQKIQSNTSINKLLDSEGENEIVNKLSKVLSNASLNKINSGDEIKNSEETEKKQKRKMYKIRHVESGDIPWWQDSNAPLPEGVQRIQSNSSINKMSQESDMEGKRSNDVSRTPSNAALSKLKTSSDEEHKISEDAARKEKKKLYKLKHQPSGELPWWLDNNAPIPEGVQRIQSNTSLNKLHQDSDTDSRKSDGAAKVQDSEGVAVQRVASKSSVSSEKPPSGKRKTKPIQHKSSGELSVPEGTKTNDSSKTDSDADGKKSSSGVPRVKSSHSVQQTFPYKIRHQESGEKAWWLSSHGDIPAGVEKLETSSSESSDEEAEQTSQVPKFPLQIPDSKVSAEAEATDNSGRRSPYDNLPVPKPKARPKNLPLFIGTHTNIDEILGTAASTVEPVMGVSRLRGKKQPSSGEEDGSECEEVDATQVRIHDSTAQTPSIQRVVGNEAKRRSTSGMIKLDDTALQLYKDGDYGAYLDLEASISEQHEELDGFHTNRKNSIVLRTQLSVRVHTIIEKLLNSEGRELRRALFSLKQIFQEDKDLVHEFVQNDGLACLIKVGSEADQNYQNYILRALGQVMLYVDGMNGVMEHNQTVQWLYALIASKFRLVVKTALKLLLVFVEYVETNCLLLIKAVHAVDTSHGLLPWSNIMKLLKDYDAADTELLIYAMTLVNKTLNGIPDQDTYYDQVDSLEEQGMEGTIQRYMSKQGTDLDLLRQFQIYEAVLHHEDGEEKGTPLKQLDENVRKTLRHRKTLGVDTAERRKSRRHSTGTSPATVNRLQAAAPMTNATPVADDDEAESSSSRSSPGPEINGSYKERDSKAGDAGVTPALRRRRERAERQRSFIREQQECAAATLRATRDGGSPDENVRLCKRLGNGTTDNKSRSKDLTPLLNAVNKMQDAPEANGEGGSILKKPWVLSMMYGKNNSLEDAGEEPIENGNDAEETTERGKLKQLKRENTVKDLTQKLSNQNVLHSPVESVNRIGDMTGLISKAKEELAKSQTKVVRSPTSENLTAKVEVKKSETELHWEELVHSMKRPLTLCDLDFTDLRSDDEVDILSPAHVSNGGPPPPPPVPMSPTRSIAPPPPPPATRLGGMAPPPMPPAANTALRRDNTKSPPPNIKKTKKTVKLFWKEVRDDPIILAKLQRTGMIWDEMNPVAVDTQKLEHLFESRAKDLITKKQQEMNKNKEVIVLDHKRSNAINIGMTKLPPPRSIKTAILKMDATIMNREGIEKLLTMLPTEEERSKIQEAQMANPDLPLGSAEQFLLTLASISELPARLKLWAFKLDFENSEKEIAEPLMDLKQGMETLKSNKTFRGILSTLLSIGIFLNGSEVKGFQIEYLAKVPEVKDTVHKHSLLHHLCHMVMEKFPDSSDLYSEIGAITRASKVDFDELAANIVKLETECKASWDHLKLIAKHDGSSMKVKMSDFLADCAERIIVLGIVHRRVMNRFHKFLLWLGIPLHRVADTKPNEFCRIVSEFSLEYRTTRERVLQQLEKKANHRERNKTRGKMITEVGKFRTKEDRADAELRQLLGGDLSDVEGTLPWRRQRKDLGRNSLVALHREEVVNGNLTDGDDEILESLVKTATKAPSTRTTPRERKRTRHADRKSLKRSRTRENNPEGGRESP